MNNTLKLAGALLLMTAGAARADVWPTLVPGGMKHILIGFDNNDVSLHLDDGGDSPLTMMNFGNLHTAPADVLDGKGYNDQYGWLADGLISPPVDGAFWIRRVSAMPGLEVYEGGMRMM
ncbi:MAG: hypothetical protein KDA33_09230, partial [Phycisphaerales bacterium]|nr:hypothetical protein [Phycisphaerales bacterium]